MVSMLLCVRLLTRVCLGLEDAEMCYIIFSDNKEFMNLLQLCILCGVVEHASYTKAVETFFMKQPAVSLQIKLLERVNQHLIIIALQKDKLDKCLLLPYTKIIRCVSLS